ncbi:MAG: transposase [Pseudomonas sp.]|nr:MAG: transposase [Pseudomonas sp.]
MRKFRRCPLGYFHVDMTEVRTAQGTLHLFVTIDVYRSPSSSNCTRRSRGMSRPNSSERCRSVPYKIHTVLIDNGTHFTKPTGDGWTPKDTKQMLSSKQPFLCQVFEFGCAELDIEYRLTKPRHPWTNGLVERMARTIKDAIVKRL